jgi:hypothetical protein
MHKEFMFVGELTGKEIPLSGIALKQKVSKSDRVFPRAATGSKSCNPPVCWRFATKFWSADEATIFDRFILTRSAPILGAARREIRTRQAIPRRFRFPGPLRPGRPRSTHAKMRPPRLFRALRP